MIWHYRKAISFVALAAMALAGCRPQQPFYFHEDGGLAHYIGMATEISYPDVKTQSLQEVELAQAPLTLENQEFANFEEITLEEAVQNALANGKVLRNLGGRFASAGDPRRAQVGEAPNAVVSNPQFTPTIYDPAIQESSTGLTGPIGPEAALAAFDEQLRAGLFIDKTDRPANFDTGAFGQLGVPAVQREDAARFEIELSKMAATGSEFFLRNRTTYSASNSQTRLFPSEWRLNMEAGFRQPLLQGAGVQYNRIAGPYSPFSGVGTRSYDGVILARINTDITLADFEGGVRNLVRDVENTYWELYFAYRNLEARKVGLDSSLETWKKIHALYEAGLRGGEAEKEAQAREQYYNFLGEVQTAKSDLFRAENRLRYMMGLSVSDGRLFRPADDPVSAKAQFDWYEVLSEGLARSVEVRQQRWRVKQRELELIASKNHLLPRLDAIGLYRWHGFGDHLLHPDGSGKDPFHNAAKNLVHGDFQEWELGLQLNVPLGFRRELADVRHHQLLLTREKARVQEQELELSHQLADAIRNLDQTYTLLETNFNRRVAAEKQVRSVQAAYDAERVTLDLLLEAQRRLADAESAYFRSLVDYTRGIAHLHYTKGSLLEYNGVYLAEGPWPQKAYFDAHRLARRRDASKYLNYGFTRPEVISRGPYLQHGQDALPHGEVIHGEVIHGEIIREGEVIEGPYYEPVPLPQPQARQQPASAPRTTAGAAQTKQPAAPRSASGGTRGFDWGSLGLTDRQVPAGDEVRQVSAIEEAAAEANEPANAGGAAESLRVPSTVPVAATPESAAAQGEWRSR